MMTLERQRLNETQLQHELRLVEDAQRDPRKFGVLYEKYYKQIYLFVYKRTGETDIAGDVTAQVFMKAMVSLPKYSYRGVPFSAWLYRIASNEVNQHFRNTKGDRTISIEKTQVDKVMGMVDEEKKSDLTELYLEVMLETLHEMDPDDIEIIELRFFEDRPFSEVGYILNITENNAKVKVYRIVERLRKKLKTKLGGNFYEA
jgi:RNA polymerase sigma-70 factor (ECF subfamily)